APRIFHVGPNADRYSYQVRLSCETPQGPRDELVLVDAQDGSTLHDHSLVDDFEAEIYPSHPPTDQDTRIVASLDGDPVASPAGWVDETRSTHGNNVEAATDMVFNNSCCQDETQPQADQGGGFFFPWSGLLDPFQVREASVVNAFYLVND